MNLGSFFLVLFGVLFALFLDLCEFSPTRCCCILELFSALGLIVLLVGGVVGAGGFPRRNSSGGRLHLRESMRCLVNLPSCMRPSHSAEGTPRP